MLVVVYVLFLSVLFCFLMIRRPPRSTRTDTLFPSTTLFRSAPRGCSWRQRTSGVSIGGQPAQQLVSGGAGRLGRAALQDGERAQQADGRVALVPAQVAAGIAVEIVDRHSESSAVAAELVELDRGERSEERRVGKECVSTWSTRGAADN